MKYQMLLDQLRTLLLIKKMRSWETQILMLSDQLLILHLIQKSERLKKIPDVIILVTNTAFNTKIREAEKKS